MRRLRYRFLTVAVHWKYFDSFVRPSLVVVGRSSSAFKWTPSSDLVIVRHPPWPRFSLTPFARLHYYLSLRLRMPVRPPRYESSCMCLVRFAQHLPAAGETRQRMLEDRPEMMDGCLIASDSSAEFSVDRQRAAVLVCLTQTQSRMKQRGICAWFCKCSGSQRGCI